MKQNEQLIIEIQAATVDIYHQQRLNNISGLDESYIINGKPLLVWYYDTIRKSSLKQIGIVNYEKIIDDLLFCCDELLYFTAHLYFYLPFINNPIEDGFYANQEMIYPNFENLGGRRFSMFSDITCQKTYNYWDRIGDLIASYFPERIKPHNVFFPTAIEAIPQEYHISENYLWLKRFKENEYSNLNKIRKQIVHYNTSRTEFNHKHLELVNDKEAMYELQAEREKLPDFYKNHITLAIEGFEKTLLFIEEINPFLFPDIE